LHPRDDGKTVEGNGTGPIDADTFGLARRRAPLEEGLEPLNPADRPSMRP